MILYLIIYLTNKLIKLIFLIKFIIHIFKLFSFNTQLSKSYKHNI